MVLKFPKLGKQFNLLVTNNDVLMSCPEISKIYEKSLIINAVQKTKPSLKFSCLRHLSTFWQGFVSTFHCMIFLVSHYSMLKNINCHKHKE